jgi:nicotinate phosphoribosyltransferase
MHFQSMIASKAIRCVMVAGGRRLIDFGMRRAHGAEAALLAARAAFLAGFDATATVEAGRVFGIPLSGTMAHSFVQAHDREEDAFRNFAKTYAGDATLLVDTYNTEHGVALAAELAREMKAATQLRRVRAVRIDSGDLAAESLSARRALNAQGCDDVQIVLSGNLDEYRIQSLLAAGAPVDAFGVGTSLTVSSDSPSLDVAYKLVEYAGRARLKRSTGKTTWPGPKQVYRELTENGVALRDHVVLAEEVTPGQALLKEVMRAGQRVDALPTLQESRSYCRECVAQLPESLRSIEEASPAYEVRISESLQKLARTR